MKLRQLPKDFQVEEIRINKLVQKGKYKLYQLEKKELETFMIVSYIAKVNNIPRKEIGIRTIFNILGPLTNPAGARCQVIGVYDDSLTDMLGKVLANLGSEHAFVVRGEDGLDEITLTTETKVTELKDGKLRGEVLEDFWSDAGTFESLFKTGEYWAKKKLGGD